MLSIFIVGPRLFSEQSAVVKVLMVANSAAKLVVEMAMMTARIGATLRMLCCGFILIAGKRLVSEIVEELCELEDLFTQGT